MDVRRSVEPDLLVNLERFPWPFPTTIVIGFFDISLEHMCASVGIFQSIIREFYRVRNYGARISIFIKHQFSSLYYYYPTCVRAISPIALSLFDRSKAPGTTIEHMAIANGVDFEVTERTVIQATFRKAV